MKIIVFCLIVLLEFTVRLRGASFLEQFGLGKTSTNTPAVLNTALSQDEISGGLKEALSKGVERAVAALGKDDGFLKDVGVKIPMPEGLRKIEHGLRSVGQEKLTDEFITTMNRAAEKAVPEAATVLAGS